MQLSGEGLKIRLGQTFALAIATLTLLAPLSALTAERGAELFPRCGGPFQLCGYVEKDNGVQRIPQQFEVAEPFSEGLAAVRVEGLYGFIDTTGKIVIEPRFQNAGFFTGEYAEIRLDNASGIINRSGELVVSPQFRRIIPFVGDTFVAQPFLNKQRQASSGNQRLEAITDPVALSSYNDSGLFHAKKGWLSDQNLKFSIFDKPQRGLIWAGTKDKNYEDIWGLMRADGTWQVTPQYHRGQRLMESHAVVESMPDYSLPPQQRREALRRGAVDRDGNLVVPLKFAHLSYWRGGYGVGLEGKPFNTIGMPNEVRKGIVRADGTLLADRYFDNVDVGEDGRLPRGRIGKTWYSIEPNGRLIPDQLDGKAMVECSGGLSIVRRGDTVEFRRQGDSQPVGQFDHSELFHSKYCPGPFTAKRGGKWFIVLEDGSVLGGMNGFENVFSFFENHAAVQIDGKWGIIDRSGAFTIKPSFTQLRRGREGKFEVGDGKDRYWINAYGKRVEMSARDALTPEPTLSCDGGLRFFEKAGLWGLQDIDGKTVIEPRFRALSCFKQGVTWTAAVDGKAWCPTGRNGKRHAMECGAQYYPTGGSHSRPEKFSDDPYESSVLWNRAWLDYQAGKRDKPPQWIPPQWILER